MRDATILPHSNLTKIQEISKSSKTKQHDKFPKYEKSKPNTYTKKDFHKNRYKINQYQNLGPINLKKMKKKNATMEQLDN